MTTQNTFDYYFSKYDNFDDYFVNSTNKDAYNIITENNFQQNILLFGPRKSGKTSLLKTWVNKNQAIIYNNNLKEIIKNKINIAIDDVFENKDEEEIFHIINHCKSYNLKILVTTSIQLIDYKFKLSDFISRLRAFYFIEINNPDDEMCKILLTKFFYEKQIIVKNKEIFNFIFKRISRTYFDIYQIVEKIDKLSLEKKRQLTIPLIKEIL
tara:strand:- start:1800 stop:2432 length:633 start_codon:yes stop_codon:yes gene_type:complete